MHGPHYYYDGVGWVWGLLTFLFWAALIALIVWSILRLTKPEAPLGPRPPVRAPYPVQHGSPREILDRRYASGEIDADTYEDMRTRLEGEKPDSPPTAST
ncbi:SHOCT domain-containing protein [Glycomyces sp. L485]|uniref:SHOCT domain-containing protein n=1 Tax=Glycomyces sp. L485 TaxID=2909235 RepID=UPI001F4B39A1|nr:SHOCT domain-containing protein [Glycomyces sp. L485]MCH7229497.1 SHOCT domain-containing protein [Glycomyces sp. L485]